MCCSHKVDLRSALLEKIPVLQDGQSRKISALYVSLCDCIKITADLLLQTGQRPFHLQGASGKARGAVLAARRAGDLLRLAQLGAQHLTPVQVYLRPRVRFHEAFFSLADMLLISVYSLPAALLTVAPSPSTPFNKLVYRTAVPDHTIADSTLAPGFTKTITLDLVIPEMDIKALEAQNVPSMNLNTVECKIGVENAVDVMMPDR